MPASPAQVVKFTGTTNTSGIFTVAITPTAGHALSLFVILDYAAFFTISATDDKGNTWSVKQGANDSGTGESLCAELAAGNVAGGATTVSINIGFAIQRDICGFIAESASVTSNPVDTAPSIASGSGTTATSSSTGTLAQADEIAYFCVMSTLGSSTHSTPAGWTDSGQGQVSDSSGHRATLFYKVVSATTALAPASTLGTSRPWFASIMTLKAAASTSAAVTGTGGSGMSGAEVRTNGTKTLISTLTGETFSATDATAKQAIIDSWVAASSPTWGWNAVRALIPTSAVVFTGNTVATFTIPALSGFQSDADQVLTQTIPSTILTGGVAIVAAPTVAIARTATDLTPVDSYTMAGTATRSR